MAQEQAQEDTETTPKKSHKKITIISFVVLFLFCSSASAATWYYVASYKTEDKFENSINFKEIDKNRELKPGRVTPDFSSGEAVIKTYYRALAAKDWETAYSCLSKEQQGYTSIEKLKPGWENYKKIGIKTLTVRYQAASARIYEAMVVEDVEYKDASVIAGSYDTHFYSTADVDYNGNWRITQIATSPINL